jgi:DNA gyrase subunit A
MLVTDGGQLIRCPVHDVRVVGRKTQGVVLFKVAEGERVVSVAHLAEEEEEGEAGGGK